MKCKTGWPFLLHLFCFFGDRVLLCSLGGPRIPEVDQSALKLKESLLLLSPKNTGIKSMRHYSQVKTAGPLSPPSSQVAPQPGTNINMPHAPKLPLGGSTASSIISKVERSGRFFHGQATKKGRVRATQPQKQRSRHQELHQPITLGSGSGLYPATFLLVWHHRQRPYPHARCLEEGEGETSNKTVCRRAPGLQS